LNSQAPIELFVHKVVASLADRTLVRLTLTSPSRAEAARKILGRGVMLKGRMHLSLTLRHPTRDLTKNLPEAEVAEWLRAQLGMEYRSALLGTTTRDWQFISDATGQGRLVDHKPARRQAPTREHDEKRAGILDATARDWLQGLGIMDRDGKLRASMADKHRQIDRYLEILSHLIRECGWTNAPPLPALSPDGGEGSRRPGAGEMPTEKLNRRPALQIADMGCGKGYLTFGLWHLLHRVGQQPVRVIGVEARPDLVAATTQLATRIHADGLEFVAGTIATAKLPQLDALIALHACNTATDDAIRRGVETGARLIVVAPCCHQELRPQLGRPEPLAAVLRHGLMAGRMAEWMTDGLRALFLEWAGYRTKAIEFVSSDHTPKNLMLAAVREREPFTDAAARQRIIDLKSFFGIERHALDCWLEVKP
jgi:SAM-dependent methyltransferase